MRGACTEKTCKSRPAQEARADCARYRRSRNRTVWPSGSVVRGPGSLRFAPTARFVFRELERMPSEPLLDLVERVVLGGPDQHGRQHAEGRSNKARLGDRRAADCRPGHSSELPPATAAAQCAASAVIDASVGPEQPDTRSPPRRPRAPTDDSRPCSANRSRTGRRARLPVPLHASRDGSGPSAAESRSIPPNCRVASWPSSNLAGGDPCAAKWRPRRHVNSQA